MAGFLRADGHLMGFRDFHTLMRRAGQACAGICMMLWLLWTACPGIVLADELLEDLSQTLAHSLKAETENTANYREKLSDSDREKILLAAAVNGYELQLSTFGNLLFSSGVDLVTFQKARSDLKNSMVEIQKMMEDIKPGQAALAAEKVNTFRQRELIDKQISELDQMEAGSPAVHDLIATARQLSDVLAQKAGLVEKLDLMMQQRLENLEKVKLGFSDLAGQFDATIEQRKNRDLFQRQKGVLRFGAIRQLRDEAGILLMWAGNMVNPEFWIDRFTKIWEGAGLVTASLILVFAGAIMVLARLRKAAKKGLSGQFIEQLGHWHRIVRDLVNRSVFHGGMVLVVFLYSRLTVLFTASPFLELMAYLMLVLLISRWFCTVLSGWPETFGLSAEKSASVRRFVKSSGLFACFYLILQSMLGPGAGMLIFLRMAFALALLVWTFRLWRDVKVSQFQDRAVQQPGQTGLLPGLGWKSLLLAVGSVTLFLDMIGFGSLSRHWLRCWGISGAVILWWGAFFCLLREWDAFYREKSRSERNELLYDDYPVQWLMIRFGRFIWFGSFLIVMLLTWGNPQTVLTKFYQVLAHPIKIGNMDFSMLGFLYAALVLLFTYIATRLWRWIFQTKFLNRSGMEVGLQDSLTTITTYVIWIFGVLLALHVFGLNTASLAVAFGALGIGLGFGLQNIFNNFISGIILLFERPIQVGDDVEINGIWANVRKINVRSTVVQTYDNASLIIPNADFISNQVTNWSFKDKRLRRKISVGVAYGSDVALVRQTLLEVAANTPKVLKYPKPDVLFSDFGDSALIFVLRLWTDINHMLIVETDIRFEIDRMFRERGIEISFPQRDIHIRSTVAPSDNGHNPFSE